MSTGQATFAESTRVYRTEVFEVKEWRLQWGACSSAVVATSTELDEMLDNIHAEAQRGCPVVADLISPSGDVLSVGLGLDVSVLSFVSASGGPPYLASAGDDDAEGAVAFCWNGEWSEFPARQCIPAEEARRAVREFFTEGSLSPRIRWVGV